MSHELELSKILFQRLEGTPSDIGPEKATSDHRGRLERAMVETVVRHGYSETTVGELVAQAKVSKRTFYEQFDDKEDCFLATFDGIVARASERIAIAYQSREGFPDRLREIFQALVSMIVEDPAEARFVIVDSLSLGAASVEPRARVTALFESMIRDNMAEAALGEASEVTIRAIVGGIRSIAYRALRDERPEELGRHVEELTQWGLDYRRAAERRLGGRKSAGERLVETLRSSVAGADVRSVAGESNSVSWNQPANGPLARRHLTQRERILRGTAQAAAETGYAALSIPTISAAAGVSNETFYQYFASKLEAFLAAFHALAQQALETTAGAFLAQEGWLEAGTAGVQALLGCFVEEPLLCALAFVEVPAAGPEALNHAEMLLEPFKAFLRPNSLPDGVPHRPPEVVIEAIAGGIWAVVQGEVVEGRVEGLPDLAAKIVDLVLVPFGVE